MINTIDYQNIFFEITSDFKETDDVGTIATYIPELGKVNEIEANLSDSLLIKLSTLLVPRQCLSVRVTQLECSRSIMYVTNCHDPGARRPTARISLQNRLNSLSLLIPTYLHASCIMHLVQHPYQRASMKMGFKDRSQKASPLIVIFSLKNPQDFNLSIDSS